MSGCLAIKGNGLSCRGYAEIDTLCCKQHSRYFDKDIIESWLNVQYTEGIRYRIEEALRRKLVIVDKSFFENKRFSRRIWQFILLCSRYTEISESWNPTLWNSTITILWSQSPAIRYPSRASWKDIQRFICVKGDVGAFYRGLKLYPKNEDLINAMSRSMWRQFFESCTENTEWFLEFAMTDPDEIVSKLCGEDMIAWLAESKNRILNQFSLPVEVRDDVIAIGNHPSRVISWGGEKLMGRWDTCTTKKESLRCVIGDIQT